MKNKKLFAGFLVVLLICSVLFTGCQNFINMSSGTSNAGDSVNTQTQAGETEAPADRYREIIDISAVEGKLAVYFLDLEVGADADDKSGDSALVISPDGKVMLIDAGYTTCGDMIVDFLKELGITKIDYLVASHPHVDHIGGMPDIVENFEIGIHYRSAVEYTTQAYYNYINAVDKAGIPVEYVHEGDSFMFGDLVTVEVYNPGEEIVYPESFPDNSTQFLNNGSLLLKFTYGESTILFGGDLYLSQETDLVDRYGEALHADVAKANHHGADTSNSRPWVKAVSPQIVVGMGDDIGAMSVYELYTKKDAAYYHTAYDGYVRVTADDAKNYEVISQYDSWLREE